MNPLTVHIGDSLALLKTLPSESAHCCVTSPPYWGLRDYGVTGQLGLEATPQDYVANLVAVFAEVRRVLRNDGTLWLNLGDAYARNGGNPGGPFAGSGTTGAVALDNARFAILIELNPAYAPLIAKRIGPVPPSAT